MGSGSFSTNKKEMDRCLEMQQFYCTATDENTWNYFKWRKRKEKVSREINSVKILESTTKHLLLCLKCSAEDLCYEKEH